MMVKKKSKYKNIQEAKATTNSPKLWRSIAKKKSTTELTATMTSTKRIKRNRTIMVYMYEYSAI